MVVGLNSLLHVFLATDIHRGPVVVRELRLLSVSTDQVAQAENGFYHTQKHTVKHIPALKSSSQSTGLKCGAKGNKNCSLSSDYPFKSAA